MLTQAYLNSLARVAISIQGEERVGPVTYRARASRGATPTVYPIGQAVFLPYDEHFLAMQALTTADRLTVLRTDRRIQIPTEVVTWPVGTADDLVRWDGTAWLVMAVNGGPGMPFYLLQGRQHV